MNDGEVLLLNVSYFKFLRFIRARQQTKAEHLHELYFTKALTSNLIGVNPKRELNVINLIIFFFV